MSDIFERSANSISGKGKSKWARGVRFGIDAKSDLNVTPLIDVVLVLLIIFMVITPMLQLGYEVSVPPKVEDVNLDDKSLSEQVIVSVTSDGNVYINKEEIKPINLLSTRLNDIVTSRRVKLVFFSCDEGYNYSKAMSIIDAIKNCKGPNEPLNVGIVLQPVSPLSEGGAVTQP
jgi:biopolymer transport protein TolR